MSAIASSCMCLLLTLLWVQFKRKCEQIMAGHTDWPQPLMVEAWSTFRFLKGWEEEWEAYGNSF